MPTIDVQVGASPDDGHVFSGGFNNNGTSAYAGRVGSTPYTAFYRFTGVTIPQSSTINVCYLTVYEWDSASGTLTRLYFEKANDPGAITGYADYLSRVLTTAGVDFDGDPGGQGWYNSPSLVTPMQELINAYGLNNQAIQVMQKDDGSPSGEYQRFRSWDYSGNTYGVKLHIEYSTGGATAKTSEETGAGAESRLLQAAMSRGEAAAGADARQALLAALVKNESGVGIEQSLLLSLVAKLSAEAGSGIETHGLLAVMAAIDSGRGVDVGWLAGLKNLLSGDFGVGGDALKALLGTSGAASDMKLPGHQGHVRIPSKGVSL